jgi:hypothetical protein
VKEAWLRFVDPRFFISFAIIGLFAWAFGENVTDETMKGALIAAFAGAWGYWIGSSRATEVQEKATENTGAAFRAIEATAKANVAATPTREVE